MCQCMRGNTVPTHHTVHYAFVHSTCSAKTVVLEYSLEILHCSLCFLHCKCVSAQGGVDFLLDVPRYMTYSHIDYLYITRY